jgi:hypothetical protein
MVLVSHIYKFIYLKNYKVAGSSVESFFGQFCIDPSKIHEYRFDDKQDEHISEFGILGSRMSAVKTPWFNHKNASDIQRDLGHDKFNTYFKFCVVRNPYDLIVSSYFWDKLDIDFKTYCQNYAHNYDRLNSSRIFINNKPICQYYIRYENLLDDIIVVLEKLGIKDYTIEDLPNHKSGVRPSGDSYRKYYDDETRAIVKRLFRQEIDLFGYKF